MPSTIYKKSNVLTQQAADQALVDGFTKHQATVPASFRIAGVDIPTTTIVSTLKARIAARAAVAPAKASYQVVVQASGDEILKSKAIVSSVRQALGVMFDGQTDILTDFGLKQRKAPAPRTPEEKLASKAKAKATREARHTMGPKEKAKITGANPQGNAPAASPAPAPAAAPTAAPVAAAVPKS